MDDVLLSETNTAPRWWTLKDDKAGPAVWQMVSMLKDRDSTRRLLNLRNMRLYGTDPRGGAEPAPSDGRLTINIVKMYIDAVIAEVTRNKPRPVFLTSGGNWSLRRRARLLERTMEGEFHRLQFRKVAARTKQDELLFGTGLLKIYAVPARGGKLQPKVERVFPGEVLVDPLASLNDDPQEMYQYRYVPRDAAARDIARDEAGREAIRKSELADLRDDYGRDHLVDQIEVVEAWHLPDVDGKGGKHVIACSGGLILAEDWEFPYFPFLKTNWSNRPRGYWGIGLAEELTGVQIEVNRLLIKFQKAMHLIAVPRTYLLHGSKLSKPTLTNEMGTLISVTGSMPEFFTPSPIPPEMFAHLQWLIQMGRQIARLSDTAMGETPQQLRSGIGVLNAAEVGTRAFKPQIDEWEDLHMRAAERIVDLYAAIDAEGKAPRLVAPRDKFTVDEIEWSEVNLERDQYTLRVYPSTALPQMPAGRLEAVMNLMEGGMIDQTTGLRLLDFPDLDAELSLDRAASDDIDRQLESILDEGHFEPPEPFQDLTLALKRAQSAYLRARNQGVHKEHPERLDMLRDYMELAFRQLQASLAAQQGAGQAAGGPQAPPPGPEGAPLMAPTGAEPA